MSVLKYLNDTQTARLWAKIKAGFVAKSGDTMTGALTLAGDPVSDLQAATKKYVDDNAGAGGGTAKIWTGYCTTAADVVPKVITLDDPTGFSLDQDNRIAVRFYNGIEIPSTGNPALNVNDTGNKHLNIPIGINTFTDQRNKLICARGETCFFSYNPYSLNQNGAWVLETSGLLLSKAYDTADAALPKAGGTMTGALTLAGDPVSDLQAATKKYVDDNAGSGGGTAKIWTGYCTTAADVEAKVVVLDDPTGFSLSPDNRIAVKFVNGIELASDSAPTLNVNNTGAWRLYSSGERINTFSPDVDKLSCSTYGTCLFSFHPGLSAYGAGGWVRETSGFVLSKAYSTAMSALPVAGGSMAGPIVLSGAPTSDLHAATKKYVDDSIPEVPTKVSDLTNDAGYITGYTETDPTVPSWAKASSKPSYTASEVGAVPTTRTVNGKALSADITLSASDVSALPSSTTIPTASTTNPSMDGTASYGSGTVYARSNHVHPTDTSRQAKITASGLLKGDGSGGVSAATAGTDYLTLATLPIYEGTVV